MVDARQRAYLDAMGIALWELRRSSPDTPTGPSGEPDTQEVLAAPPAEASMRPLDISPPSSATQAVNMDWEALRQTVAQCRDCELCESRTQTVFGVGDVNASLMIIGEAPGADEDRLGEPFVGRAGQLLSSMLAAIGLPREQVYIANTLKCRPPGNRDPRTGELAACRAYLDRQIGLVRPDLILAVGGVAAKSLLHTEESVGRLRSRELRDPGSDTPVRVTYHPAYLLRRPEEKGKAWADLQQVWRDLQGISGS